MRKESNRGKAPGPPAPPRKGATAQPLTRRGGANKSNMRPYRRRRRRVPGRNRRRRRGRPPRKGKCDKTAPPSRRHAAHQVCPGHAGMSPCALLCSVVKEIECGDGLATDCNVSCEDLVAMNTA